MGSRKIQDLLNVGGKIFHQTHWAPLLQMQGSISEVRLEVIHRDGRAIPMLINALRRERDGVWIHDIATFVARDRDKFEQELIAARKKLETTILEAKRLQAQAKDRATFAEQMVGIVSHDLRNPLATIDMGATLLARGDIPHPQRRILERMKRATDRADRLISDLLDFTQARIGAGLRIALDHIDLHSTVAEAIEELSLAHPNRKLIHVRHGNGLCLADADRLSQLVGNLVSNAVGYSDPYSAVTIESSIGQTVCSLSVANLGAPIARNVIETLFEPMVRGDAATNAGRSIGLGLYIVSEIAKAHGGTMEVSSGGQSGTVFRAVFPFKT